MDTSEPAGGCCAPARDGLHAHESIAAPLTVGSAPRGSTDARHRVEQVNVPAQTFQMGDAQGAGMPADGELPVHPVRVAEFSMDATSVTNSDFARFVEHTGYRTEAETFGFSAVFHLALRADESDVVGSPPATPWWLGVRGADWRHPGGARSSIDGLGDHPVVHVSWNDALAYCRWAGRALPTEAQWECASRGGLPGARYPWGEDLGEQWRCNIWQGTFPTVNTEADGWLTTAPVRSYEPNGYGLWQTVGNVWEWCADWWDAEYYARSPERDPLGPEHGRVKVLRGGSYLCHDSYCNRYRTSARSSNTPDSSMGNAGFRTVSMPAQRRRA